MPRHRFMRHTGVLGAKEPIGISPAMLVKDEKFAVSVAKSSLAEYNAFCKHLQRS